MNRATGEAIAEIPVGVEPEGMAVSPDDSLVVNTSEQTSMAHIIDAKTNQVLSNILVDTRPREATFTRDGGEVWVSAEVGGTVAVIDTKTFEIKKKLSFEVPGVRPELMQPIGIRFTLDGKTAFIALGPSNRVAVVDVGAHEIESYILVGQRPWHLALKPDGTKIYVANGMTNDVTVIDVATLKAEKSVPVGRLPWGVVVKPEAK
jgi:PQQ-dependent catabolism-associated beta-propeller protein